MSKVLRNILYIEDEPDIQRVVKLALEVTAGMNVITCSSGSEAIARAPHVAIDLILLDVMMPQMDGPTTLARLREIPALARTPAVFMTAKAHPHEIASFKALGALDVIAKPFDPMSLASTLRSVWAQAIAASEQSAARENPPAELTAEERFAARMKVLTEQFQRELPSRFEALRQHWRTLNDSWSLDALSAFHHSTHNLAGSGATFGYDELTTHARAVDRHLKVLLDRKVSPDTALQREISALFVTLEAELQRILVQLKN